MQDGDCVFPLSFSDGCWTPKGACKHAVGLPQRFLKNLPGFGAKHWKKSFKHSNVFWNHSNAFCDVPAVFPDALNRFGLFYE